MLPDANLQQVAQDAVASGLFNTDPEVVRVNEAIASTYERLPATLLNVPYVNGPVFIEIFGRDIPEASVLAVRRNFTEVNRLLLPKEQVLRYFHQRFVADDIFGSEHVAGLVQAYRAPAAVEVDARVSTLFRRELFAAGELDIADVLGAPDGRHTTATADRIASRFKDPEVSFQIKGVDRRSHVRALYTRDEQIAALELTRDHPAVVLAILAYQSVIQDYLGALRQTFDAMAVESPSIRDGLGDFDKYTKEWATPNFTVELIPALAIFLRLREHSPDETEQGTTLDADLFRESVNFIIANGAFRHWITVPAEVAREHEARVNHFLCPAVGAIREHTWDGSMFEALYNVIAEKADAKDSGVSALLEHIRLEASTKLVESDRTPTEEDIARLQERLKVKLTYRGRDYSFALDAPGLLELIAGTARRDDVVITAAFGTWFYDVLREAIATAFEQGRAVFFQFNGRGYRLTPGRLIDFLRKA